MCTPVFTMLYRATNQLIRNPYTSSCIPKSMFLNSNTSRQFERCFWNLAITEDSVRSNYCQRKPPTITKIQKRLGSASAVVSSGTIPGVLTKTQAKELAVRLTPEDRQVLISALQECQSQKLKAEYEGQLAAFRWRSKFGRPSKVPTLGDVDPTGKYCAVPDDWLLRKYVDSPETQPSETVPKPCRSDLIRVAAANAIPFIGFGFLDNAIMIIAGDSIEATMGAAIPMSTMTAAAFGNTISDILGIGSAYYVELLAQKIGFEPPKLTPIQLALPICRGFANMGRVLGVTIGCLLGMTPLLFMHKKKKKEDDEEEEKIEIVNQK